VRGFGQLTAAVSDMDVPQAGEPVDVLVAVGVLDDGAAPSIQMRGR
jgi:hypothetical protein